MSISKDHERGTYYVQCYYRDWTGERKKKTKRGFKTKKAAAAWEVDFLRQMEGTPDMTLNAFYELYKNDIAMKVRITTQRGKQQLIETKILPYLGEKKLTDITPLDILSWQNAIQSGTTSNGLAYKDSYLRTIGNQLSAMLNHAVRFYNLPSNPMSKVDRMGSKKTDEMRFWIKDEYKRFSRAIMDKDVSFMIFEVLYWLGVRSGEALALTPADFDLKRGRVSFAKTYHRIDGEDVTTPPKTRKSNRVIVLPRFLIDEVKDYLLAHPSIHPTNRPDVPCHQELPQARDGAGMQGRWTRAHPNPRPAPQPCLAAHRDGLLRPCHRRQARAREHRGDHDVRPSFPQQAGRDGAAARRAARPERRLRRR